MFGYVIIAKNHNGNNNQSANGMDRNGLALSYFFSR